ncbi:MAG: DUF2993 domain-containing protein [Actinobacteria bacterium]|nr:MAG: DUF2993 domain-containing protein [Actinomycetota bacterium]
MRKILFGVIVLLALLLAAEVGITLLSQHGMERALSSQYGLPSGLEVSINSFPYLISLARNHLGELQLTWEGELQYGVEEGAAAQIPYAGRVNLYDVELNMPSLLSGKLEIRDISRLKSSISLAIGDINQALGMPDEGFFVEDERLYMLSDGEKVQYKVKVIDEDTLSFVPVAVSTTAEGSSANDLYQVETILFYGLPMRSCIDLASVDGDRVVLEISIPMWEGYL